MFGSVFGEYLVNQEVISKQQLEDAVLYQKEYNILLGKLAMERGYLDSAQVEEIINEQKLTPKKFGKLAKEKGYLTEKELEELKQVQSENHIFLGEVLNRLGYIDVEKLNVFLNSFKHYLESEQNAALDKLNQFSHKDMLQNVSEVVRDYFYYQGYVFKVKDIQDCSDIDLNGPVFLADQEFNKTGRALFGLQMSEEAVKVIAQGNPLYSSKQQDQAQEFDTTAQVVYNLNFVLCEILQGLGYKVKPGAIRFEFPREFEECVVISFDSILGTVNILYYFFNVE